METKLIAKCLHLDDVVLKIYHQHESFVMPKDHKENVYNNLIGVTIKPCIKKIITSEKQQTWTNGKARK